jgi:hypothetical protein
MTGLVLGGPAGFLIGTLGAGAVIGAGLVAGPVLIMAGFTGWALALGIVTPSSMTTFGAGLVATIGAGVAAITAVPWAHIKGYSEKRSFAGAASGVVVGAAFAFAAGHHHFKPAFDAQRQADAPHVDMTAGIKAPGQHALGTDFKDGIISSAGQDDKPASLAAPKAVAPLLVIR